jgi:hypothetical protein
MIVRRPKRQYSFDHCHGESLVINSERHSGELKSRDMASDAHFEFGGHRLPIAGTSGPPSTPSRVAEGKPVPAAASRETAATHFEFAGHKLLRSGTSGPAKEPSRLAEGRPVARDGFRNVPDSREAVASQALTGSGFLTGGPVRRG